MKFSASLKKVFKPQARVLALLLVASGTLALLHSTSHAQTLDSTFGTNGITRVDFELGGDNTAIPKAMLVQKDGKILFGGIASQGLDFSVAMARLLPDGSLDNSFGTGGKMHIKWGASNDLNDLTIDSSGRIVGAGTEFFDETYTEYTPTMYRFRSDGTPDSSFALDGRRFQAFSPLSRGEAFNAFVGSKGRYYGVGPTSIRFGSDSGLAFGAFALDSNGIVDTSYHGTGMTVIQKRIGKISAQFGFGGKIFMASRTARLALEDSSFLLFARFNPDGSPDTKVGPQGYIQLPYSIASGEVILTDPMQSRFIFGFNTYREGGITNQFMLVKWNNQLLRVDSTFGVNGSATGRSPKGGNTIYDCSLQPDGKILTAGLVDVAIGSGSVFRFLPDGTPDSAFGLNGELIANLDATPGPHHFAKIVAIDNFSFYVLGYDNASNGGDMFVAKYKMPVSSVKKSEDISTFSLYPNPANTNLTIECIGTENKISINDELGREITNFTSREQSIHYDISQLASGVYYCTVESTAGKETKKFIVNH